MSQILYLASNCPLAESKNPHYKMLSVNEALAIGMENIPEFMLEPEFDRNQPSVLLWSDTEITIDTETNTINDGGLDDDLIVDTYCQQSRSQRRLNCLSDKQEVTTEIDNMIQSVILNNENAKLCQSQSRCRQQIEVLCKRCRC